MSDLHELDAVALLDGYRRRTLSPVEVTTAVLDRIDRLDPQVNCFVTVVREPALAAAAAAERRYAAAVDLDRLPPMLGVPVSVKDLEDTAGVRTTYGSVVHADHVPVRDAPVWARLKAAGAVLVGKTTTPELGASGVTESELTGITRNPWSLPMTTGGSSGGAAAAVATGLGPIATGSDGGGSIRVPASFCGVVGLKPTLGRIPFNSRESAWEPVTTAGPLSRTVRDSALVLTLTHGPDPYDPLSLLDHGLDYVAGLEGASINGLRVGWSPDLGSGPVAHATSGVVRTAVEAFEQDLGAVVDQVWPDLPDPIQYFNDFWEPLIALEQLGLVPDGRVDGDVLARFPMVARALQRSSLDFARTLAVTRTQIHTAFADVFATHDLLVWPTTPSPAFRHPGEVGYPLTIEGRALTEPALDNQRLTEAISHAGFPAISVPAGFTPDGLPVGLQIAAARGRDDLVLRAAAAFERVRPWAHLWPELT